MLGKNSTKVIFSAAGSSFLLKPILHIKSNSVQSVLFQKVGLELSDTCDKCDSIDELSES